MTRNQSQNRTLLLILIVFLVLGLFGLLLVIALYRPPVPANPTFTSVITVRAVRVDYLDESKSRAEVDALETQLRQAGTNLVALGAGRAEWTYFPWPGHPDRWSADVKTSGHDYLLEDSTRFGKWAHVSAVVDVLAPLYIQAHPEAAALSWTGIPSENLVATVELVNGPYGQELLDMINEIATNYPVNSITLTELVYYVDGFGDQDKAAYHTYTGRTDWPRHADGTINIDDVSIGGWRSYEIGRFLDQAASLAHAHGKQLFLEAHLEVEPSGEVVVNNGSDLIQLLKHVDRLIVRGNNDLGSRDPAGMQAIAHYLAGYDQSRIIMGVGLWEKDYSLGTPKEEMQAVSAEDFQSALEGAQRGGATNLWVTPSFLMVSDHWQVLRNFWGSQSGK